MRLCSWNKWQIIGASISRMLNTKLTRSTSIDHLWIVVIPLGVYLMCHIFLVNVVLLRATSLNCIHHIGRTILFECLQMVILSRSDDGLLGIGGADIVVLVSLSAGYSVGSWTSILIANIYHLLILSSVLWMCTSSGRTLAAILSCIVKWDMDSPIGISKIRLFYPVINVLKPWASIIYGLVSRIALVRPESTYDPSWIL